MADLDSNSVRSGSGPMYMLSSIMVAEKQEEVSDVPSLPGLRKSPANGRYIPLAYVVCSDSIAQALHRFFPKGE